MTIKITKDALQVVLIAILVQYLFDEACGDGHGTVGSVLILTENDDKNMKWGLQVLPASWHPQSAVMTASKEALDTQEFVHKVYTTFKQRRFNES